MKETFEFRVNLDFADLLFQAHEGKELGGMVKVVQLTKDDPRLSQMPEKAKEVKSKYDEGFYFGWQIKRTYTKKELTEASLFSVVIKTTFEPAGEECGSTSYNWTIGSNR